MAIEQSTNPVAVAQANENFNRIVDLAMSIHHLFAELIDRTDGPGGAELAVRNVSVAIASAGRDLASQIGFHADSGTRALGGRCMRDAPEDWLVRPRQEFEDQSLASQQGA